MEENGKNVSKKLSDEELTREESFLIEDYEYLVFDRRNLKQPNIEKRGGKKRWIHFMYNKFERFGFSHETIYRKMRELVDDRGVQISDGYIRSHISKRSGYIIRRNARYDQIQYMDFSKAREAIIEFIESGLYELNQLEKNSDTYWVSEIFDNLMKRDGRE